MTSMHWGWMGWIEGILLLAGTYYAYKSMRNFYRQGRAMTIPQVLPAEHDGFHYRHHLICFFLYFDGFRL